jgi:hypothetical protein
VHCVQPPSYVVRCSQVLQSQICYTLFCWCDIMLPLHASSPDRALDQS